MRGLWARRGCVLTYAGIAGFVGLAGCILTYLKVINFRGKKVSGELTFADDSYEIYISREQTFADDLNLSISRE